MILRDLCPINAADPALVRQLIEDIGVFLEGVTPEMSRPVGCSTKSLASFSRPVGGA